MQDFLKQMAENCAMCKELSPSYIKPVQLQALERTWGFEIPPNDIEWATEKVLYLNLSFTPDLDLTALVNLPDLVALSLLHSNVTDISVLRQLPKITYLDASHSRISDFSVLRDLPLLDDLDVDNTGFDNISLLNTPALENLSCNNTQITSISGVERFKALKVLNIANTKVTDLSPLQGLLLRDLDISGVNADLSPLKDLPLEFLNVSNTPIEVIPDVDTQSLKDLMVNFTGITNIAGIQKYQNLETFVAIGCDIKDFTPLLDLPNIQELTIGKGRLPKYQKSLFRDRDIEINFYDEATYY